MTTEEWDTYTREKKGISKSLQRDRELKLVHDRLFEEREKNKGLERTLTEQAAEHSLVVEKLQTEAEILEARRKFHKFRPLVLTNKMEWESRSQNLSQEMHQATSRQAEIEGKLAKLKAANKSLKEERKTRFEARVKCMESQRAALLCEHKKKLTEHFNLHKWLQKKRNM
ncbi:hypothetical protein [Parasitella parasitica]|uniref:Uncharacterized protein n=1 Tax=Parasitella parasitica TaxID=35722 RepID=A0A0B7NF94_9FUNG|nr:hypothetical protein [Parasitella parasitica]